MYTTEKNGPFSNSLKFLKMLHQIPLSMDRSYLKKFFAIFLLSKMISFFFTTVGPVLFIIVATLSYSEEDITEAISITLGGSGGGIACLLFTIRYKEWYKLFKDLADVTKFGKPATYQQTIDSLNLFANICVFGSSLVTIGYGLESWYSTKGCKDTVADFDQICPKFAPIWLPFGTNSTTAGSIIFILQFFVVGIFTSSPFLIQCFIMYESTEILICHISHLNYCFKETFEASSMQEIRNKLRFCINYHVHILKLGNRLSFLIKYTAGHISLIAASVCGCVAQMINTKPMGSSVFLAGWLFALFCFCHAGQKIKDKTLSIGDELYKSKWYKADRGTMKDVQLILLRSQKPICFEAIPLGVTDYPFYFMMLKTGYSYFALLNQAL
nr:odorant receptor 14 [Monochamus saltuarius]